MGLPASRTIHDHGHQNNPKKPRGEDTKKICKETIESLGASSMKDMGKIMGTLKQKYSDSIDFSKVSVILKGLLS